MNTVRCPNCEKTVPEYANFCASCGESMTSPRHASARFLTEKSPTKDAFQGPYMYPASQTNTATVAGKRRPATVNVSRRGRSYSSYATRPSPRTSPQGGQQYPVQDVLVQLHDEDARPLTWQKILDAPVVQEDIPISPRPTSPRHVALTPLPKKGHTARRMSPVLFFWVSVVTVLLLSLSGAFGVFVSFGRGIFGRAGVHAPTLQASSNTVAIGATLTLHGSNFSPHGRVGLTRDAILPIADTGGASIIQADSNGNFTDTVTITPDWQAGTHTINAEDAKLHKIARFSLIVTGKSTSLRPAHFAISTTTLDFGAGDIATNSTQKLTLSNTGGGQITWQASTDQPWLLLTPDNGTFAAGAKVEVTVAVDRSNLHLGTYNAQVNFLSNVGSTKVSVAMQVIPLDPGHDAVLQVSPAVLSFTAPDGGAAPPAQVLTVRNPGVRPLQWAVSTNAPWLSVSPNSGSVQNTSSTDSVSNATIASGGAFQNVNVNVDTSSLLPGTYSGIITFQGQGTEQVKDSPQNVLVTITITPQCGLQVSPFLLTFASVYGQSSPASKTLNVSVSQSSCTTPIQWSATTTASWLVLSTSSGTTPVYPSVSVNTAGLMPGTYTGSIVFSTASGTETLPVTFTLGQTATPIMSVASTALTFNGVIGQPSPGSQSVVVTNTGSGTLNWQATVATSVGGNWLSLAPAGGSLGAQQSTTLAVTVTQLRTLPPGIYNGMITLTGNDGAGHGILGSPQLLSVSFVVQASCTVTTGPSTLTFATTVGQSSSATQPITIAVSGACTHATAWTVTPSASKNWLVATPATGIATASSAGKSNIGVVATGLAAGNYSSALTITAIDSVTHQAIGAPFGVAVTLTVQPACALQAPSVTTEAFTTIAGQSPAAQTFSLAVGGVCTGNVTITPTIALGSGTGWLTVTPATATVLSGGTARFTVTVNGTAMKAGSYGGSITLVGVNNGVTIAGSPQTVGITVTVSSSASLSASAGKAGSNGTNGVTAQPVNIANTGGTVLSWTATIANAPSFVSLSPVSGTLAAGTNTTTGVVVDAAKATAGRYKADVTITATDPATGLAAVGSPTTVRITILIAPPSMQVNTTNMTFSTPVGTNPATQSINITNIGGGTLTWTVGTPSASWLTVSPTSGSDAPNITSSPTFSVDVTGLAAGTYTATVSITPSAGSAVTVTATLTVAAVTPSPTPTVGITPTPTPTVGVTPTPTAQPTPSPTPTAQPTPTVGVTPTPTAQPTPSPTPTVSVTPTPTANVILSPTPTAGVTPTVQPTPNPTPTEAVKPTPTP